MQQESNQNIFSNAKALQKQMAAQFSLKELLFKYLSYLPFILLIFSISVGVGYVYIRYKEPVYKASVQILIKSDDGSRQSDQTDLIQRALKESKAFNIDNEITKIKSLILLRKVVERGNFNIKLRNIGRFRSTTLFHDSPYAFEVLSVKDSSASFEIKFKRFDSKYAYLDESAVKNGYPERVVLGKPFDLKGLSILIQKKGEFNGFDEPITLYYEPSIQTARKIAGAMSAGAVGKTSIIQVDLRDDNPIRAREILNTLVTVFQEQDVEMKKVASVNTISFINERLSEVAGELDSAETNVARLRKKALYNDVELAGNFYRQKLTRSEDAYEQSAVQLEITNMLEEYINNPNNGNRTVPVDIGIDNTFLQSTLREYNSLQLVYEREKAQLNNFNDNKILADYQLRLKELRYNILETIKNIKTNFAQRVKKNEQKSNEYKYEISVLPELEKDIKSIQTQSVIKKELFLYLLKRREEIAITSATFVSSYDAIDAASASFVPVEPKSDNIRNFSILIGLIIPIVIIYLIDLFNDKVTLRDQILKKLDTPIAGEVSHVANPAAFVFNQSRSLVAEQFRIMRTNLSFLFKGNPDSKVILISSTISGEGKSFVSSNLSAAISVMEKKVALLLFDLRKANVAPVIDNILKTKASKGITNYLIGQTDNFPELYVTDEGYSNLHIYPSGPIPPNPAELLLSNRMKQLFEYLRNNYDYVVVDSAPAGLVSDAFILQDYVDVTLYIIRQQFTLLKQLEFIGELTESGKLRNVSIVVNDVTMGGRYGYYGYNYGYGYSYSYKYGYGYKYLGKANKDGGYYTDNTYLDASTLPWWVKLLRRFSKKS